MVRQDPRRRPASLAACAVVVAASLGSTAEATVQDPELEESSAVEQISRYCSTSWRNAGIGPRDWSDCTQEAFAELLSRVERRDLVTAIGRPDSEERRELNRSIWCTIQRWRRSRRLASLGDVEVRDARDENPSRVLEREDDQRLLEQARSKLNGRQNRILGEWLDGRAIAEIADDLEASPARVSDEKYKAIRRLRRTLRHAT